MASTTATASCPVSHSVFQNSKLFPSLQCCAIAKDDRMSLLTGPALRSSHSEIYKLDDAKTIVFEANQRTSALYILFGDVGREPSSLVV